MSMLVRSSFAAVLPVTALALALVTNAQATLAADPEKPKLEGQHTVVACERNGLGVPAADIKGVTFRITGDKLAGALRNGTEFITAEFTLDPTRSPCTIVMRPTAGSDKGQEYHGLVERKNDTIRLIWATPGGDRPTEFKTKENQVMYTMQCEKK